MSTMTMIIELYRGTLVTDPDPLEGTALEDWDGTLDKATWAWLEGQGYGEDPDLWANVVPAGVWAPANRRRVAERQM